MEAFLFYFFSGLAVAGALSVIFQSKPTHALLSLIVTMFSLAVLFILLGAYFVAMVHLIVYAGAVLVLFLFVIMLQGTGAEELPLNKRFSPGHVFFSGAAAAAFLGLLVFILLKNMPSALTSGFAGDTHTFGISLFQDYLLPFELTSLLLLIGVFAAVSLAKPDSKKGSR